MGMKEYRKVLVPIDGSEASFHALKQAFQFSSTEKSWITVVCVVPEYEGDLDTLASGDNILKEIRRPCEEALAKAKEIATRDGYNIKTVLEEGEAATRIIAIADVHNRELIIMGRRGLSNLERSFVGSVTQRVIGLNHGDVLVCRMGHPLPGGRFSLRPTAANSAWRQLSGRCALPWPMAASSRWYRWLTCRPSCMAMPRIWLKI